MRAMRDMRIIGAMLVLIICCGVLLFASSAHAGTKTGQFAVEDGGRAKCQLFIKARSEKSLSYGRYLGFIEGYLTAANRYEPNTFDLTPWHSVEAFGLIVDQHCRKNPQDSLVEVAQRLVIAMQPFRLADFSKLVEVQQGSHSAIVYETILKRAQAELHRRGLYKGAIDGNYSPQMKTAVQEFQSFAKLDPSGVPDAVTLWVLLNP